MYYYLVRRPEDSQLQKHLCCSTEGNPLTRNPSQIYKLLAGPLSKDHRLIYSSVCNRNICQWVHQAIGRVPPWTLHNCLFPVLCWLFTNSRTLPSFSSGATIPSGIKLRSVTECQCLWRVSSYGIVIPVLRSSHSAGGWLFP